VDTLHVAPAGGEGIPVVFARVRDVSSLEINLASSGYDLAEYFHQASQDEAAPVAGVRARSDEIRSLFPEDPLPEDRGREAAIAGRQDRAETAYSGDLAGQLAEHEQQIEAGREAERRRREAQAGTTENIYRDKVASRLRDDGAGQAHREETRQPGLTRSSDGVPPAVPAGADAVRTGPGSPARQDAGGPEPSPENDLEF
jgi:hypothetical protein